MLQEAEEAALNQLRIAIPPPLSLPVSSLMEGKVTALVVSLLNFVSFQWCR